MHILCVCGVGQGSSLVLKMNVETVLKELGIEAKVEHSDVTSATGANADYIITSNELAETLKNRATSEIIIVNNFFDTNEIKHALQEHIK